jgi:hypothetical protein
MATNKIVYGNTQSYFMMAEQSAFATIIDQDGTYFILECPVPEPDYGLFRDQNMKNTGSRVLEESQIYVTQDGELRVIPVNDIIVRKKDACDLMYAVCQNVSEGVGTPYTKTYTIAGAAGTATTQPDFSADAGYFCTLGIVDPVASNHRRFKSCIGRSVTFSANTLTGDDARMRASAEFISGFASDFTTNFTGGTYAFNAQNYFNWKRPTTASIGGADVMLYGFSVTISNGAYRIGLDSSGNCETYALPMYKVTGSITTKYDAVSDGLIATMAAGSAQAIVLRTGTDAADGEFCLTMAAAEITNTPRDYGGDYGQAITIEFEARADSSTGALLVAEIADAVDRGW